MKSPDPFSLSLPAIAFAVVLLACPSHLFAMDWLTLPSTYTHDVATGQRVTQFAPIETPTTAVSQPLRTGGYTHYRSTLAYGQSADNYHRVEEWGDPVRPYGEWRFPYRPYSTPYANWGQPYGGLNIGVGPGYGWNHPFYPGQPSYPGQPGHPTGTNPPGTPAPPPGPPGSSTGPDSGSGSGSSQWPHPGHWHRPNPAAGTNQFAPYPSGRGTPYPVAPYYDGYYPNYGD
ncbi:hypothetical protein [Rhodopirellula halodulae]|uniref:hypothetical protein n=1 Tax=Rhodopirellula halodulae TaxID=2894198 RepID=UPI001E648F1D|nr:hypothetical protein [Rhodopirellula sp. JC737]MCC9657651.1 hypothetical protein [Rhodopirellula sp. JC737]